MYYEHRKESAAKELEALNLEAAKEDTKNNTPLHYSSTEKHLNGTSKLESEMNGGTPAEGVENKAYVTDEKETSYM
jgi:hypothetical protein